MSRIVGPASARLPVMLAAAWLAGGYASAQDSPDGVLGTIDVNGSTGTALPLPKLAIEPLLTHGRADEVAQLVARGDFVLSGQFAVLEESAAPRGPFLSETPPALDAWKAAGAEYVIRVYSQDAGTAHARMVGEVYLPQSAGPAPPTAAPAGAPNSAVATPLFHVTVSLTDDVREASHRLVDGLLGALTGQPGGFASHMVYAADVGKNRQVFVLDSDGFDLHAASPADATAISPSFGPGDTLYYGISRNFSRFELASTARGVLASIQVPGSLMGLAFSADRNSMALIAMDQGTSTIYLKSDGEPRPFTQAPLANHPSFGPEHRIAYAAGDPVQRIYIDGRPISPPGLLASAPVFCETPQGLLIFYAAKSGAASEIVASYPSGQGLHRLTQQQGSNWDPACSPDGRLLAFFSNRKSEQGAGLYVMPIARPWSARRISGPLGDSLRWQAIATPSAR